jgi:hypothetical protein
MIAAWGCGKNEENYSAEAVAPMTTEEAVRRGVYNPSRSSESSAVAQSASEQKTEGQPETGATELNMLKALAGHLGKGYSSVSTALKPPDKTEGGTNTYAYRTYWSWLPTASGAIKQGIKQGLPGAEYRRDTAVFVMAGFTQKQELYAFGATWPIYDGESMIRGRAGDTLPSVRQLFPSLKQALDTLGLPATLNLAIFERDGGRYAEKAQKPTSLWPSRNGLYAAPQRVLVVVTQGELEFHFRAYVNEDNVVSKTEKLNESSGHIESAVTASMSREALLGSPLASVYVAKVGTRVDHPITYPLRIDQTPPGKVPYSRSGNETGRSIRVRLVE